VAIEELMKIALIQQAATEDIQTNIDRGTEAVRRAADQGTHLIVFAELAFLPFFPQARGDSRAGTWAETVPGPTTDKFCALAAKLGVDIVLNLFERDGEDTFDSSPVIDSSGRLLGVSRMVHIIQAPCFYEQDYYTPGDRGAQVFETRWGRLGVAICYDRHYPEYMRQLALNGADLVVVPQAGALGEWPPGVFEAELQIAAFQNGYFTALANRVGEEECLTFAGESFISDPFGRVIARAPAGEETILYADLDFEILKECAARKHFLIDRRNDW
jgi:N-carbamoylputrescine amidase